MPISRRTHHLPLVRNRFSDSAQNFGLGTTLKPFGLRRLNKSARALGPLPYSLKRNANFYYLICLHTNKWDLNPALSKRDLKSN